ncbi:hypothetical protein CC80DRAFT_508621 [Byssothecium circinans]|uniref:BZIP domain-containing protein n=1 Tax=Byssothecium circinans TaxID=147558 RepID=A0A6A5THQ8_9PLEO|nr:hypothetical protein CC80DRAFT_508621 [Byssothecium circinans]
MASTASPSDTTSPASTAYSNSSTARTLAALEHENLERKRARDRKSQKAMRERTKLNIACLTQENNELKHALNMEVREKNELYNRFLAVSEENDHLRVQKAALQLRLLGNGLDAGEAVKVGEGGLAVHEAIPLNTSPTTMSDQILQTFVESRWEAYALQTSGLLKSYPDKPDLSALFDGRPNRVVDETSSVVGDIVRSYTEIDTLPKQVALHYVMSTLMKWQVLRTKASFEAMPEWLRPEPLQLEKPHASWIDRIPWPKVRIYLIGHPEVKYDDFASAYSSSFNVKWDYDPRHVIITTGSGEGAGILINPIYEEHVRQLRNWTVEGVFRRRFPEMTEIIDAQGKTEK